MQSNGWAPLVLFAAGAAILCLGAWVLVLRHRQGLALAHMAMHETTP